MAENDKQNVSLSTIAYPIRRDDSLTKTFGPLLENGHLSDVTFKIGSKSISAHRFVLATRSTVFETMFYEPMKTTNATIEIVDRDYHTFQSILLCMYTDQVNINKDNVIETLIAAHKHDLSYLEAKCEKLIADCAELNKCLSYLDTLYDLDAFLPLKTNLFQSICEDFVRSKNSDSFLVIANWNFLN